MLIAWPNSAVRLLSGIWLSGSTPTRPSKVIIEVIISLVTSVIGIWGNALVFHHLTINFSACDIIVSRYYELIKKSTGILIEKCWQIHVTRQFLFWAIIQFVGDKSYSLCRSSSSTFVVLAVVVSSTCTCSNKLFGNVPSNLPLFPSLFPVFNFASRPPLLSFPLPRHSHHTTKTIVPPKPNLAILTAWYYEGERFYISSTKLIFETKHLTEISPDQTAFNTPLSLLHTHEFTFIG